MKVNKIVALTGLVLSLSAGVAEAGGAINAAFAISGGVTQSTAVCNVNGVTNGSAIMPQISIPNISMKATTPTSAPFNIAVSCDQNTSFLLQFTRTGVPSPLPGAGAGALSLSGTPACALAYRISNYVPANNAYDGADLLSSGSMQVSATANVLTTHSFGIVIAGNQVPQCPTGATAQLNDSISLSVTY